MSWEFIAIGVAVVGLWLTIRWVRNGDWDRN
jgi:hypothetical protein